LNHARALLCAPAARRNFLLATYLSDILDSQRGDVVPPDEDGRVGLIEDCARLGVPIVILHNGLSESFTTRHSGTFCRFEKIEALPEPSWNVYERRWAASRDWLSSHLLEGRVLCVDLFDVRMNRDPFRWIPSGSGLVYVSREPWVVSNETPEGRWMVEECKTSFGKVPRILRNRPLLNCGLWGGRYPDVLRIMVSLCDQIRRQRGRATTEMAAFNVVIRQEIEPRGLLWAEGPPFHSVFGAGDRHADVCFVHK
jgi:hypothetical protein